MTDDTSSMREDLGFLRSLAEAGRNRPVRGGASLVLAGVIFGGVAFYEWLALIGAVGLWGPGYQLLWLAAVLIYLVAFAAVIPRTRAWGDAAGPSTRAFGMAWSGAGAGIFIVCLASGILIWRTHDFRTIALQMSAIITLYGVAWYISAALAKTWWFLGIALLSFAFAILFTALPYGPEEMLAFALAIFCTTLLPGIYLMTRESR